MSLPVYDLRQPEPQPGFHGLDFTPVDDPALLVQEGPPRVFRLIAPARSAEAGPLWVGGTHHPEVLAEHAERAVVPGGSIYAVSDHRVGGAGLLVRHGTVFWQDDVLPNYFRDELQPGRTLPDAWAHGLLRPDAQVLRVPGPVAVATHGNMVWGHFLLEMLPKLWLLAQLRQMGVAFRLAVTSRRVPWMDALIGLYFTPDELVWYDSTHQLIEAPVVLVPSLLADLQYHLHPAGNLAAADFVARALAGAPLPPRSGARLFLSRSRFAEGKLSLIGNTAEVEQVAAGLGFAVVHPQTLSIRDQVTMLAGADCIMGEYGSALHGALFMPRGAGVICLNRFNPLQDRIAALRGQVLAVVEAVEGYRRRRNDQPQANRPIRIDPDFLRRFVASFLERSSGVSPAAAPPAPAAIPTALPVGEDLVQRIAGGRCRETVELAPPLRMARTDLLYAEPIDPGAAPFGPLFTDPAFRGYQIGAVQAACLGGAIVVGGDALVIVGGALLRDPLHSLDAWRAESNVASIGAEQLMLKHAMPAAVPATRPCFLGFTGNWRHHAHWLVECLPRLAAFPRLRERAPGLRVVLPILPPDSLQQRTLALLGIATADIVPVADDAALPCASLWVMSGIDVWRPPLLVREAAQRLSAAVAESAQERAGALPTRLYLHRTAPDRRMTGFPAITDLLAARGFAVIGDAMPLDAQIRVLRNARVVVGEHGDALAGIIFARPGCRVLELFNVAGTQPMYWTLASLLGLHYGFAVGTHEPQPGQELPSANAAYRIAPEQLARALDAIALDAIMG